MNNTNTGGHQNAVHTRALASIKYYYLFVIHYSLKYYTVFYNFSLFIFHLKHPVRKQGHDIGNGTLTEDYGNGIFLTDFPADRGYCSHTRCIEQAEHEQ